MFSEVIRVLNIVLFSKGVALQLFALCSWQALFFSFLFPFISLFDLCFLPPFLFFGKVLEHMSWIIFVMKTDRKGKE